jgi:hypothetical protein
MDCSDSARTMFVFCLLIYHVAVELLSLVVRMQEVAGSNAD